MRAHIQIKMDRVVDLSKHYISPGGYEVIAGGKHYSFDFNESTGYVLDSEPTIVNFDLRDEDRISFPDIDELRNKIHLIMEFPECYIYTGEENDPIINCLKVISFSIIDSGVGPKQPPKSTSFVSVKHHQGENDWITEYHFSQKLLNTIREI